MMKRIILICTVVLSGSAFAQQQPSDTNLYVYKEVSDDLPEGDVFPGNPADPAPINQYVPVLALVAVAMVFAYARKKKVAE